MSGTGGAQGVKKQSSVWNSLEVTKIIVAAATPLAIALLGIVVSRANTEEARVSRALERRLNIWEGAGPKVRQIRDQAALIYRNSVPNLPEDQRAQTIGARGVEDIVRSVDETLEVRPYFTPAVAQRYLDFSSCAVELVQLTEFNARQGVQPFPRERLRSLWERADQRYQELIQQVRVELSTEGAVDANVPYPKRLSRPRRSRESSVCLGIE